MGGKLICRQRWLAPSPLVGEGWGEGSRSIDTPQPLTRIASDDAIRPLPQWEEVGRTLVTFGVIPAKAGIQYAAAPRLIISDCGILDHPLSRMMTRECVATDFQTANCILAARCARVVHNPFASEK